MAAYPKAPVYLFYGNQHEAILRARDAVLNDLLLPDTRDENLTEYYPTKTSTVSLVDLFDEIAGDLATISFIPDAPKCVIVTNPAELFSASAARPPRAAKKKAAATPTRTPQERLNRWIASELPQTGHHLVLLSFEDEGAGRELNPKSELFLTILKTGFARGFSNEKAFFRIENGLLARDARACLSAVRDLWKSGRGDGQVYNSVVRTLRYLMQANIARERQAVRDPRALAGLFPEDRQRSLFQAHPKVRDKYLNASVYRTSDLLRAYGSLLEVYRALRPRPGDDYVPDAQALLEQALLQLIASPAPRRG